MITEEQFTQAMRDAVAERGEDWVYPQLPNDDSDRTDDWHEVGSCIYVHADGTPACLIGLALSKIDPALLPTRAEVEPACNFLVGVVPESVRYAAQAAQNAQDCGEPWGEALRSYESRLAYWEQGHKD